MVWTYFRGAGRLGRAGGEEERERERRQRLNARRLRLPAIPDVIGAPPGNAPPAAETAAAATEEGEGGAHVSLRRNECDDDVSRRDSRDYRGDSFCAEAWCG